MERQARRAQVLRHAKRIFARKGYHRTNISEIIARAGIARGTFYIYFANKRELFEQLLDQVLSELSARVQRIRLGSDQPSPADQLRDNLRRVVEFVIAERDLIDILLTHAMGFDKELDARVENFYSLVVRLIQRSLDLGIAMDLVRPCQTTLVAQGILGGIKEVARQLPRDRLQDIDRVVEEILAFGLCGVARPQLAAAIESPRAGG